MASLQKGLASGALCLMLGALPCLSHAESPTRALDRHYGEALYHYHQGALFDALTLLEVAKVRGGVAGHGDHPLLVEGGLLLAYGLHREAKARFEQALVDQIEPASRNQAWFYLGKVLYLEGDFTAANEALEKVDTELFTRHERALLKEWHYLRAQIALSKQQTSVQPEALKQEWGDLYWAYTAYNQALQSTQADSRLQALSDQLTVIATYARDEAYQQEAQALRDRTLLSLGQLHLQQGAYEAAYSALKRVRRDGLFAEEGLFQFAVAASHTGRPEQALAALKLLQSRELFTPWLQQVPYALGYLYEQMGEPALAYEAYRAASSHYRIHQKQLGLKKANLSEQKLLAALSFSDEGKAGIGSELLETDAYGRLKVSPEQYDYAALLADERFQIALRDLHELYKLQHSLDNWARQLDSFDTMLATRRAQRAIKIQATEAELDRLQVSKWEAQRAAYEKAINQAVEQDDWAFFMNEDQMEMVETLEAVKANLALLPDDEDYAELKAEFAEKLRRAQGYFDWWLADSFGVNRWEAQKQLVGLNRAMDEFTERNAILEELLAGDVALDALEQRVSSGRERLAILREQLALTLVDARNQLLALVQAELTRQENETADYLRASREAQARLADQLLLQQSAQPQSKETDSDAGAVSQEAPAEESNVQQDAGEVAP
ncbi:MAG: hypothetical protein R3183_11525 [Oleiphilaceae bacterium]|nr:hypothetical protein [Oleiphilaceae bacterium]